MEIRKFLGVRTPKPLNRLKKNGVGDYVGDNSPKKKLKTNAPLGAWRRMREISPSSGF